MPSNGSKRLQIKAPFGKVTRLFILSIYFYCCVHYRLNQVINQRPNKEKHKKTRKMTKLAIIKAAISHIYTLQDLLLDPVDDMHHDHHYHHQSPEHSSMYHEQHLPSLIPFPVSESHKNEEDEKSKCYELNVKVEQEVEIYEAVDATDAQIDEDDQYVIVDGSEEYKIIPVEQEYTATSSICLPPLLIFDCYANLYSQQIN